MTTLYGGNGLEEPSAWKETQCLVYQEKSPIPGQEKSPKLDADIR
jgi:hypothetical protein